MNKQQQELYDKLLKKVNEFCLGQAAEDVIECIDALVDTYETPKVDPTSKPLEAFKVVKDYLEIWDSCEESGWEEYPTGYHYKEEELKVIETALKENKEFIPDREIRAYYNLGKATSDMFYDCKTIKSVITIGEVDKALEILRKYVILEETGDDIFPYSINENQYTSVINPNNIITKEEYELLKEVLK